MDIYTLRNEDGIMVARFGGSTAAKIMADLPGEWEKKTFVDSGRKNVYVISSNHSFSMENPHGGLSIYLWAGYFISKENT